MQYLDAEPRDGIYIWISWLTKLLAGENACEWAVWFKARHSYTKLRSGFDLQKWTREHDELVRYRVRALKELGYDVFFEDQNKFSLTGSRTGATISGKPDIVAFKDGQAVLEDCKTGRKRDADHLQVGLYRLLSPHLRSFKQSAAIIGQVTYADGTVSLDEEIIKGLSVRLADLVSRICSPVPPAKAPSLNECGYCDIADHYCESRIDSGSNRVYVTDIF